MAELSQVYDALRKANAAGDTASAKKLADYIRSVESQTSTKAETTETDTDSSWLRPLDLAINAIYKGVANVPDVLLNAPTTISNVYRAAKGQPLTQEPNLVRKGFEAVGGIRPEIQPETTGEKALDILTQGATGGAISGGGGVLPAVSRAGVGAVSAGTGALSAEAAKRLGVGPIGQELAGVAGGLGGAKAATSLGTFGTRPANVPPERIEAYKQFASKGARQPSEVLLRGSESQQSVANPVYNKSVGLPPSKDFGPSQLQQATNLIGNTYDNLLSGRQVKFDKPFFDTFKELFNKQRDLSQTGVTFAETRPIIATLDRIANLPNSLKSRIASLKNIPPETTDTKVAQSAVALVEDALNSAAKGEWTMDAKNYNEVRSILGADAQRAKADTRRSGLLRKMQKAFDDAADRSMPDIKDELSDVRGRY
jgi:hypothetical protein